jgi:Uncharacterized conserved protein
MGMQVAGAPEVDRIACGVSSSLELFERTAAAGAQMLLVHHGVLWDRDSRVIDDAMRRRLKTLLDAGITLAAYHLALDAHPQLGNNALIARELGIEPSEQFGGIGFGGPLASLSPRTSSPPGSASGSAATRSCSRTVRSGSNGRR